MISINYSHLCEKAFLSQNGNLNLIGVFENITAQKFPIVFPQLSIVTSMKGEPGQHQLGIKIVHIGNKEDVMKPITLNINIEAPKKPGTEKSQNIRLIGDINNLTLKEVGKYEVQILLNNEKAYSVPFSVQKAVKPIPKNR